MRRSTTRSAVLSAAALVVLAGCAGTDSSAEPAPESTGAGASSTGASATSDAAAGQRIEVEVAGGQVTGDTGRVPVPAGEQVTLVVTSDAADELHVHGYDLTAPLEPGAPAELSFAATIPGVFEVELHDAGTVLVTLQVS